MDYNQFEELFYTYYVTKISYEELSEKYHDFFTEVQERFEYTGIQPSEEDRQYGYINYAEFIEWLKEKMKELPK